MFPLINEIIQISGKEYSGKYVASMNVVADHVRTLTFAIADGAIPSNEGRGYVLRRILRRAARYGRNLDMHKPFIYKLVGVLSTAMCSVFPEIMDKRIFIEDVIKGEEEGFNETLDRGIVYFNEEIDRMKKSFEKSFNGTVTFKLHDTYGFPVDLTQLMARELGYEVDVKKFEELMNVQKERARSARGEDVKIESMYSELLTGDLTNLRVHYVPYETHEDGIKANLILLKNISDLTYPEKRAIVYLDKNPFYTESGGQVSDTGYLILSDNVLLRVLDSKKEYLIVDNSPGLISGISRDNISISQQVTAKVDYPRRQSIQRNHSATHLVHEALRRVLGSHVKQMGSYLDENLLRFDFPHFHRVTENEILEIEQIVNDKIKENINVYAEILPIDKANKIPNVKKFFGEKYGEDVRVVFIDESYSVEFCGGTHVKGTNDIGLFKIVRRRKCVRGQKDICPNRTGILDLINERVKDIEKIVLIYPTSIRVI
jgi:alanyl-tRNA synthetase